MLSIPPDLDRALAMTVLSHARSGAAERPAAAAAPPPELARVITSVVDALREQGARSSDVTLALEDAFAALLAGHDEPGPRRRLRELQGQARQLVMSTLGYGGAAARA